MRKTDELNIIYIFTTLEKIDLDYLMLGQGCVPFGQLFSVP